MTLEEWIELAHRIDRRRPSAGRYAAIDRHAKAFPAVYHEIDRDALTCAASMIRGHHWNRAFQRPQRGYRKVHWTTPALQDLNNQLAKLNRAGRNAP